MRRQVREILFCRDEFVSNLEYLCLCLLIKIVFLKSLIFLIAENSASKKKIVCIYIRSCNQCKFSSHSIIMYSFFCLPLTHYYLKKNAGRHIQPCLMLLTGSYTDQDPIFIPVRYLINQIPKGGCAIIYKAPGQGGSTDLIRFLAPSARLLQSWISFKRELVACHLF